MTFAGDNDISEEALSTQCAFTSIKMITAMQMIKPEGHPFGRARVLFVYLLKKNI